SRRVAHRVVIAIVHNHYQNLPARHPALRGTCRATIKQSFALVSLQFPVGDDPCKGGTAPTAFFRREYAAQAAPLSARVTRSADEAGEFFRGVPVACRVAFDQLGE